MVKRKIEEEANAKKKERWKRKKIVKRKKESRYVKTNEENESGERK